MTGYVRNDTGNNIADGNVIAAADLDGEFDALVAAFNNSTGHTHDGTTAEGAPITKVGPVQDLQITASALLPKTDNTLDLGSSSYEFKDLYIDGTANIDSLVADTADINGGTIDGATITSPRVVTSINDANGNELLKVSATTSAVNELTLTNAIASQTPSLSATGDDTNISINLVPKGTGTLQSGGTNVLLNGGALGTPASGTLTNCTGLPVSTGISGLAAGVATFLGSPSSANLASALTDESGTSTVVFSNSPTLVTPNLGTPSAVTLTNGTGLPLTTGVTGILPVANGGTGVSTLNANAITFLQTPSSSNLATAVTDETGSGALVFATSPTLTTPNLGTPSAATLTNATGLPVSTGISGLGTNVATALAVNVGSSGAFVTNGGALGTPSSGTLTNATDLPISTGVSGLGTNVATFLGTPSSANLAAALTDETGTGVAVFGTNPTLTGATMAGELACADQIVSRPTLKDYAVEGSAIGNVGATRTFDLETANFFSATLDQNSTFTFSNPPASGDFGAFVMELTNGGAYTVTWPASVDWPGGTAPTLTASGVDQLVFTTRDGGTTYFGFVAGLDIKSP